MGLTNEQLTAVDAKGTLLVSAAAGSGKTLVLTERVLKKIFDEKAPVDIDKLLIITFTNAAAAEMKERISQKINDYILENPDNVRAKKQQILLDSAYITTIDSFCIDIARDNFDLMNLNPEFKIATGERTASMSKDALDYVIDDYYKNHIDMITKLMDTLDPKDGEGALRELIIKIYNKASTLSFPNDWYDYCVSLYKKKDSAEQTVWGNIIYEHIFQLADYCHFQLSMVLNQIQTDHIILSAYSKVMNEYICLMEKIRQSAGKKQLNEIFSQLNRFSPDRLGSVRGEYDKNLKNIAKNIIDYAKSTVANFRKIIDADEQTFLNDIAALEPVIKTLLDMVKAYSDRFYVLKTERNLLEFSDVELAVLNFLCKKENGQIVKTENAVELSKRFDEILIDEYQDTNDLQNTIFTALSRDEQNLFYVGDVKQCIYKFRNAKPDNFINKKNAYKKYDGVAKQSKIDLNGNFRSRPEICAFINFVFSLIMSKKTSYFEYQKQDELDSRGNFEDTDYSKVDVKILQTDEVSEKASYIADYIKKSVADEMPVTDKNGLRKCKYSDFMILMQTRSEFSEYVRVFKNKGIPVWADVKGGFFDTTEIQLMLSLLKVIDNPTKDVPLLAVMLSEIFGFTSEEIAKIRIKDKKCSLYSSVLKNKDKSEKIRRMLEKLDTYRIWAATMPTDKLILKLFSDTAIVAVCGAKADGLSKQANLQLLCEYAAEYEQQGYKGLSAFIRYINTLENNCANVDKASCPTGENAVRLATIHYSKGLQTPVCILSGVEKQFNLTELHDKAILSEEYGIGIKFCDFDNGVRYPTLCTKAMAIEEKRALYAESIRLLYVAMTRAIDKLVIVAGDCDLQKRLEKTTSRMLLEHKGVDEPIDFVTVHDAKSLYDLILMCLALHPDTKQIQDISPIEYNCKPTESKISFEIVSTEQQQEIIDSADLKQEYYDFSKTLAFEYRHKDILDIQSKYSPSQIGENKNDCPLFDSKPAFVTGNQLSFAQMGTAMHKFIQYSDFNTVKNNVIKQAEKIYQSGGLSLLEKESLDIDKLNAFFDSELFSEILSSDKYIKECRFVSELEINQIDENIKSDEKTVIDGVADLIMFKNGKITIVDFKTDRADNENILVSRYEKQLDLYAKSFEKIYKCEVEKKIIYSFNLSKSVIV